jgi:hypothetical protein
MENESIWSRRLWKDKENKTMKKEWVEQIKSRKYNDMNAKKDKEK